MKSLPVISDISVLHYAENVIFDFGWLVSLFNDISTFVGYLMRKPSSRKTNNGTI